MNYIPPSVTITEEVFPQASSSLAASAIPCVVGPSLGYQTRTDQFQLVGTAPIRLPGLPDASDLQTVVRVQDSFNLVEYAVTDDYTISVANGTISRVAAGDIPDGKVVNVTYTYLPSDYFTAVWMTDLGSIENRFGPAISSTSSNGIGSNVSYAAALAFEGGASGVYVAPLFKLSTPGDPSSKRVQPTDAEAANSATTWRSTLEALRGYEDINLIVPVAGQSDPSFTDAAVLGVFQEVQDHLRVMQTLGQYIVAVLGEDRSASTTVATPATIRSHATVLKNRLGGSVAQQIVILSPAKFSKTLPTGSVISIGGQYAAASFVGAVSASRASQTMTRRYLPGLIAVTDTRSLTEKNEDASAGLTVLENKNGAVIVRHSITLDDSSAATRELSIVRAKHRMIESLRDTIDNNIIGKVVADQNAVPLITSTVAAVLDGLRMAQDIVDYGSIQARILQLDPTTAEVRFSYRPAFPINYVNVTFSIDLTAGSIAVS